MQSSAGRWQPKPDDMLQRVLDRAETLLAAERVALKQQSDDAKLAGMTVLIASQAHTIDDLTAACMELHSRIDADTVTAAEQGAELAACQQAEEDWMTELMVCRQEEQRWMAASRQAEHRLVTELEACKQAEQRWMAELAAAKVAVAQENAAKRALEHHVQEMHNSTSWRVTRPLRLLRQFFQSS